MATPHGLLPELPVALTGGASVTAVDKAVAPRPWENEGQATVELVTLTMSDGTQRRVVWKHTVVPKTEKGRKAEADKRLASFCAEAAFFTHCASRLGPDVPVPGLWSVSHCPQSREFKLLMSSLVADGYPNQPKELTLELAQRGGGRAPARTVWPGHRLDLP